MTKPRCGAVPGKAGLYLVAGLVLVPSTLFNGYFLLLAFLASGALLFQGQVAVSAAFLAIAVVGPAGLVSMWMLFFHFRKKRGSPRRPRCHAAALVAGMALALFFIFREPGSSGEMELVLAVQFLAGGYFLRMLLANRGTSQELR